MEKSFRLPLKKLFADSLILKLKNEALLQEENNSLKSEMDNLKQENTGLKQMMTALEEKVQAMLDSR